jgi:hypothetical protein
VIGVPGEWAELSAGDGTLVTSWTPGSGEAAA